ncbi:MAG: dTDP-4-dehydrorhamnose reductase [Pyrinomonadaceae bacterium]
MKILITGANGMVARAAANLCRELGDDVTALSRAELDISNTDAVLDAVAGFGPDAVINCAAFTDVDGAEADPSACFAANSAGVENLAAACRLSGSAFVTISTDYVFDGSKGGFYTQRDTPRPQGVYASAKRDGEIRAFAAYPRSIIVRSGWIFGDHGRNFLSVIPDRLRAGHTLTPIADSFGTPTYAPDLALRLRELAEADLPGVYHVVNAGDGCSYMEFAEKVCEIGGFDKSLLQPASVADLKRPAPRPVSSKLACLISEKLGFQPLRPWENALAEFVTAGSAAADA